jgi:hypothetical protein
MPLRGNNSKAKACVCSLLSNQFLLVAFDFRNYSTT